MNILSMKIIEELYQGIGKKLNIKKVVLDKTQPFFGSYTIFEKVMGDF